MVNAQTQNFIRSNSAIRIFVDLTQSSRHFSAVHLSPFSKQHDYSEALFSTTNLRQYTMGVKKTVRKFAQVKRAITLRDSRL
jgi:hypothetical protein